MAEHFERVDRLRGWPEIGQTYLVPTVRSNLDGLEADWPVHARAHVDLNGPGPEWPHYHFDPRFLTEAMEDQMARSWEAVLTIADQAIMRHSNLPLGLAGALSLSRGSFPGDAPLKTKYRPMVCRYRAVQWDTEQRDHEWNESEKYLPLGPVPAILTKDGRPLCPHQKTDLACVWDGKSKTVRCPLHGVEVDMSAVQHG